VDAVGTYSTTLNVEQSISDYVQENQLPRRRVLAGVCAVVGVAGLGKAQSNPEVGLTLNNQGASAWVLQGSDADVGPTGVSNPALTLTVGTRYRIENRGWSFHPLAFRDANDQPLLTQDGQGSFQNDSAVDWVDNGETLAFTLTPALAAELDDYVCTIHPSMVGRVQTRDDTGGGESSFDLTGIDPTSATVESGTVIDVSATVENTGDAEGTQTVTLELGGVSFERELTLAGGDAETVVFEGIDTSAVGPGEYSHTVSTEDTSTSGSLTVQEPSEPAAFEIVSVSPEEATATQGDTVTVSATVQNTGDQEATQTVNLDIDGLADSSDLTLGGGETDSVSFDVDTSGVDAGEYSHTVSTEDDEFSGSLTIEAQRAPATFELQSVDPEQATVSQGEALTVSTTVQNTGDREATKAVTLELGGRSFDSDLTLAGGESGTVSFDVTTDDIEPGEYTHTVNTADDTLSGTLQIEMPAGDGANDGDDGSTDGGDDGSTDGTDGGDDGSTDGTDGEDGAADGSGPGFGVLGGLAGLGAAAGYAYRRIGADSDEE
jgi:PGF-CTERM protein